MGSIKIAALQRARVIASVIGAVTLVATASHAQAQRSVPFNNNIPVAPSGIQVPPLPTDPVTYHTAEGQDIRVVVLTLGLVQPWSVAFLPDGDMLVTERPGRLRLVHANGALEAEPIAGVPEVRAVGLSGLFDVALHPDFAANGLVYLTYNKPGEGQGSVLGVARGVWDGKALDDVEDIFIADAASVSRLAFGQDGMLYVSTFGGMADAAQDPMSLAGKVLRLTDEGKVPPDNPFVSKESHRPEIFTLGHRSTLGLVLRPGTERALGKRERSERRR